MTVEPQVPPAQPQPRTAYGRFVRERGTLKLVLAAIVVAAAWYAYDAVRVSRMMQVKWPSLPATTTGLTVLGLQDKDRPGWRHKYEAKEVSHAWQIRYRDDTEDDAGDSAPPDTGSETREGGANPGASHSVSRGAVVPLEELMRECPVVLNGQHFSAAWVEERYEPMPYDRHYYVVHLSLTDEGSSRYWQFSREHEKERLAFVLDSQVLTCPRMDNLYVRELEIQPIWVKADADTLARFINGGKAS